MEALSMIFGDAFAAILVIVIALGSLFVLLFKLYLWLLLARLMRLGCKFLKAQFEYYHSDCGN